MIASIPPAHSLRDLVSYSRRVPFTKEKMPWCPCPFKNEANGAKSMTGNKLLKGMYMLGKDSIWYRSLQQRLIELSIVNKYNFEVM